MTAKVRNRAKQSTGAAKGRSASDEAMASYCTCAIVRRAARRLTQSYDDALRPLGLRITQYMVLAHLDEAGLSVTDLASRLAMDRTTLTRNLRPLERAGWIRVGDGPDKRSRCVRITEDGRALYHAALPVWRKAEQAFRRRIGREDAADLRRLLTQAAAAI